MMNKKAKITEKRNSIFQKILLPLDSSPHSNYSISRALEIGKRFDSLLVATHVYAARLHEDRFKEMETGLPAKYQKEEELERQRDLHGDLIDKGLRLISDSYFSEFAKGCQELGINHEGKNIEGKNFAEIAKEVKTGEYDLVIMGALGLGAVEHSIIGTVCERVVREVRSDCLVVKEDRPFGGDILVAVDGSPSSFWGIKVAMYLKRVFGGEIEAISVFDPYFHQVAFKSIAGILSEEASNVFKFEEQEKLHDEIIDKGLAKIYQDQLNKAGRIAEREGVEIKTTLLAGKPYNEIIKHLSWKKYSVLVTGRQGIHSNGLDLGGNTENLLRMAPCNIIIASREYNDIPEEVGVDGISKDKVVWDDDTIKRLDKIPFFARGMAKKAIEDFAREKGTTSVTDEIFDTAAKKILPSSARGAMGIEEEAGE
ncbi:MAG: universal stress protein [Thermodesulfobacteriota bacterium]